MQQDKEKARKIEAASTYIANAMDVLGLKWRDCPDMADTPTRVAKWIGELSVPKDPPKITQSAIYDAAEEIKMTTFAGKVDELVIESFDYDSVCAHHLLPFFGKAYVGYLPRDGVIGASKIPRIVDHYSRNKVQSQEYLTESIAQYIQEATSSSFVGVILTGHHTCCSCRGVRKSDMSMSTSKYINLTGSNETKKEFIDMVSRFHCRKI